MVRLVDTVIHMSHSPNQGCVFLFICDVVAVAAQGGGYPHAGATSFATRQRGDILLLVKKIRFAAARL